MRENFYHIDLDSAGELTRDLKLQQARYRELLVEISMPSITKVIGKCMSRVMKKKVVDFISSLTIVKLKLNL